MIRILISAAVLTTLYLLVVTSVAPGDVAVGAVLGLTVAVLLRPRGRRPRPAVDVPPAARFAAVAGLALSTARGMVVGTWRTVLFCLGRPSRPGFVEIPRGDRSPGAVAVWGLLIGQAPDEIVVDVDDARAVLTIHSIDARDPAAVQAQHAETYERWQRRVVP